MIRFAFIGLKLIKPRNVLIDRVHSNTFVRGIYLGSITGFILCLQVEGPINIWGVEGGGGGLYYKRQYTSIRYFGRRGICRQFGRIAVKRHKTA